MKRVSRKGFTLVEILVVVAVLGIIMVAVMGILFNAFRSRARITIADLVDQNGTLIQNELKTNVVTAAGVGMGCVTDGIGVGSTLSVQNIVDGSITNIVCYEGDKISLESTGGNYDISSVDVKVSGCSNFARCELFPDSTDRVIKVNFNFSLSAGNATSGVEKAVSRVFESSVVVRN